MLAAGRPFVLLDDARPGGAATLYRDPVGLVEAWTGPEVGGALATLRAAVQDGLHAAGWIGYEAGYAGDAKLAHLPVHPSSLPLLWFGLFEHAQSLSGQALAGLLGNAAGAWAGTPAPRVSRADYDRAHARVQALIEAGDIYQANLSLRADVPIQGSPLDLYTRLRRTAGAGWGGIVHDGRNWLLSLSPELFFRSDGASVETRPMKGTAPRGRDAVKDAALAAALAADPKQRAENLMIVDLIRNDLSRVAQPGSVRTSELFTVESYPTVHQMVSAVEATLSPGRDTIDVLAALFPCGSITGAPKLRAMEVIAEVEADGRGVYTGTIGALNPENGGAFNVAIRTLVLEEGRDHACIGLGSAVVADSTADGEWNECLAKGAFLTMGQRAFDLFETMRFDPDDGIVRLDEHIARLGASAAALEFGFDRHELRNELHAATFRLTRAARVRVTLGRSGAIAIEVADLPAIPAEPVAVRVVPLPVDPQDFRLRHKTTDRAFYTEARRQAGTFEAVFARPDGQLTEGSFTSVFVSRNDRLITPPLELGLLPGIHRAMLIAQGDAIEGELAAADLRDGFFLANDLRGLMKAHLA